MGVKKGKIKVESKNLNQLTLVGPNTVINQFRQRLTPQVSSVLILTLAGLAGLVQLLVAAAGSGVYLGLFRLLRLTQMIPLLIITGLSCSVLVLLIKPATSLKTSLWINRPASWFRSVGWVNWIFFAIFYLLILALCLTPLIDSLRHILPSIWLFTIVWLPSAFFLSLCWPKLRFYDHLLLVLLSVGCLYQVAAFLLKINNDPFSATWSEGSQIYLASTFFSKGLYGASIPLPVILPSYELLISIPFFVHGLPIWVHRLWEDLLWLGCSLGTGLVLLRHFPGQSLLRKTLFVGWVFLFVLQISVYFHLLLCVMIVLVGFTSKNRWVRLVVVLAASIWAGFSRINWFPLPGVLGAVIYILQTPLGHKGWRYFITPILWIGLGTVTAALTDVLYISISGNPAYYFSTIFTSIMLAYRLLPSATNPPGLLLELLLFASPVAFLILYWVFPRYRSWHGARLLALIVALSVFLCGGLVVSLKIGGGNNLHNLDAFLILLMVIGCYLFFDKMAQDQERRVERPRLPGWVVVLAASLPILMALPFTPVRIPVTPPETKAALENLQTLVNDITHNGNGEILFMTQRQLLTFNIIQGVKLAPEYEKYYLMEMAMAGNKEYFNHYDDDLRNHRFALIITDPVSLIYQGRKFPFGEENDVWLKWVTTPLLQYYKPVWSLKEFGLEAYVPN
jgi:hypothetical protein